MDTLARRVALHHIKIAFNGPWQIMQSAIGPVVTNVPDFSKYVDEYGKTLVDSYWGDDSPDFRLVYEAEDWEDNEGLTYPSHVRFKIKLSVPVNSTVVDFVGWAHTNDKKLLLEELKAFTGNTNVYNKFLIALMARAEPEFATTEFWDFLNSDDDFKKWFMSEVEPKTGGSIRILSVKEAKAEAKKDDTDVFISIEALLLFDFEPEIIDPGEFGP